MVATRLTVFFYTLMAPVMAGAETLTLYNWPDYMPPAILEDFTRETGHTVKVIAYESDELKTDTLISTRGEGFDMMVSSGYTTHSYVKQGWIGKLDESLLPHLKHCGERWRAEFPDIRQHAIPYLWGTIGIAWRNDKVTPAVTSWQALLAPDASLKGRIMMFDDAIELTAVALKSIGKSMTESSDSAMRMAEAILVAQKPYVSRYGYETISDDARLIQGSIWMTPLYNGDGIKLQAMDNRIRFTVPEEGTSLWIDYVMILEASSHKKEAHAFLDYLYRPDVAARLSNELMFATPNDAARPLQPAKIRENKAIYPDQETLARSEVIKPFSDQQVARRNAIADRLVK